MSHHRDTTKPSATYQARLDEYAAAERKRHDKGETPGPISAEQVKLLTDGLEIWLSGVESAKPQKHSDSDPSIVARVEIFEPDSDKATHRFCDPGFLYAAILHVIHGGSFLINSNRGPDDPTENFYWVVNIYGGKNRKASVLPLIVGTERGYYTAEAKVAESKYHDVTREALGKVKPGPHAPPFTNDRDAMIEWSLTRFAEPDIAPRRMFDSAHEYKHRIDEAYVWLGKVPLRHDPQAR